MLSAMYSKESNKKRRTSAKGTHIKKEIGPRRLAEERRKKRKGTYIKKEITGNVEKYEFPGAKRRKFLGGAYFQLKIRGICHGGNAAKKETECT